MKLDAKLNEFHWEYYIPRKHVCVVPVLKRYEVDYWGKERYEHCSLHGIEYNLDLVIFQLNRFVDPTVMFIDRHIRQNQVAL